MTTLLVALGVVAWLVGTLVWGGVLLGAWDKRKAEPVPTLALLVAAALWPVTMPFTLGYGATRYR